jgi:hypothetical protein
MVFPWKNTRHFGTAVSLPLPTYNKQQHVKTSLTLKKQNKNKRSTKT